LVKNARCREISFCDPSKQRLTDKAIFTFRSLQAMLMIWGKLPALCGQSKIFQQLQELGQTGVWVNRSIREWNLSMPFNDYLLEEDFLEADFLEALFFDPEFEEDFLEADFFEDDFFEAAFFGAEDFLEADFFDADFLEADFLGADFLEADFFEEDEPDLDDDFLEADFLEPEFEPELSEDDFSGTFAPSFLASESPMAIACSLLFTFCPDPERSVPSLRSCIVSSTFSPAFLLYFAMVVFFNLKTRTR
jgi:hypothetical protein